MKQHRLANNPIGLHHSDDQPHLMREIMRTNQALMGVVTRKIGMPSARLALLRLLAISYPEKIGVMKLAKVLGINASAVTRQIKEMETDGLVSRLPTPGDARRFDLILTSDGLKAFDKIHKKAHEFEARLYQSIGQAELDSATKVLCQVRKAIEEM